MVFIRSAPLCVKELYEPKRAFRLQFVSFLEALCRLADIMYIPDKQVQITLGFDTIMKGWWGWYGVLEKKQYHKAEFQPEKALSHVLRIKRCT
jgi:hypothetical protein